MKTNFTPKQSLLVFVTGLIVMSFIFYSLVKRCASWLGFNLATVSSHARFYAVVIAVAIILLIAFYVIGEATKWPERLMAYSHRKMQEGFRMRDEAKRQKQQHRKESYAIKSVEGSSKVLCLVVKFSETLYRETLPVITVNKKVVSIWVISNLEMCCHLEKIIDEHMMKLCFAIGKNSLTVHNPYFMDASRSNEPVPWQCEGNPSNRKILIPQRLFPNVIENIFYPFTLYIDGKSYGDLFGTYDPAVECVVVPVGGVIHRRDCAAKQATLRVKYGRGSKILLAKPTVLEGLPVQ